MSCEICQTNEAAARVGPEFIHSRTIRGLIEGLEILSKYMEYGSDQDAFDFQHDVMYAGPSFAASEMSDEDRVRLGELGWSWDDELDSWRKWS
jgi:hypothetical protein